MKMSSDICIVRSLKHEKGIMEQFQCGIETVFFPSLIIRADFNFLNSIL